MLFALLEEIRILWPDLSIVHGRPRHSQSQGSVERANQDVENKITVWCRENNTTQWSRALPFVQLAKNSSFHSGISRSPYAAVFGNEPKIRLIETKLPPRILQTLRTEEDLEQALHEDEFQAEEAENVRENSKIQYKSYKKL